VTVKHLSTSRWNAASSYCSDFHNQNSGLEYLLVSPSTGTNRDHFLQADSLVLIRTMPNWIASESPTIRAEQLRENVRKSTELIRRP